MSEVSRDHECWLPVVGYEGMYEVSDHGRVRSLDRWVHDRNGRRSRWRRGQVLKPWVGSAWGHLHVKLPKSDSRGNASRLVHCLVAEAFIGPRPPGMEVLHGPSGASDNRATRLRYGTSSENHYDTVRDGTNWHRNLTACPRQHLLELPNLVPSKARHGIRQCLACSRGNAKVYSARTRHGIELDLKAEADRYYAKLMGATAA